MIRRAVALLGGMALALGLFWLLALLVVPPHAEAEKSVQEMTLSVVKAPQSAPAPAETSPAPVESVTPPPPAPAPPSAESSAITLPDAELPDAPAETVALESRLPELTEAKPRPSPKPKPEPAPEPVAKASPAPSAPSSRREASAEPAAEPAKPTSTEPVDVGQATPTSRVNPVYPSRAQRRGMEGFVEVRFIIRRDGSVKAGSIDVTRAKPRRMFDKAARKAVAQWQFEPSDQRRRATQRIQFKLR
ncbi:MAG: TonB family protein [Halomonas subglaciescola]|nr:TonB family protein [Halomonas subglaciescola]